MTNLSLNGGRFVAALLGLALIACGGGDSNPADGGGNGQDAGQPDAASQADAGGLQWQDPPASDQMARAAARTYCENLDHDNATDWRLPTITELRALVAGCPDTEVDGHCNLVDVDGEANPPPYSGCDGCAAGGGPGLLGCYWEDLTGPCDAYWSTTTLYRFDPEGLSLDFGTAYIQTLGYGATAEFYVRCVRGSL